MNGGKLKPQHKIPTWRIVAVINFPIQPIPASAPIPGQVLPQKLTTASRILDRCTLNSHGISVVLRSWPGPPFSPLPPGPSGIPDEPAALVFFMRSKTPELALQKVEPLIEALLDELSFQLQTAVRVFQLEALDVTPPVATCMERRFLLYPFPNGYPSAKFSQSMLLGNTLTVFQPDLNDCLMATNARIRGALRWYVKGIASLYDVDKFILFWITLEILRAESGVSIDAPYLARCGHEIPECPTCGQQTSREQLGKSNKAFLINHLGTTRAVANDLWKFRQILHGARDLTPKDTSELARLVMALRQAVVSGLKRELGIPPTSPPFVSAEGELISPIIVSSGTRAIDDYDADLGFQHP